VQQVRAAEHYRKGASAEYFPSVDMTPTMVTWELIQETRTVLFQVSGRLNIPIFQGGKVHADVLQAEATLWQHRAICWKIYAADRIIQIRTACCHNVASLAEPSAWTLPP